MDVCCANRLLTWDQLNRWLPQLSFHRLLLPWRAVFAEQQARFVDSWWWKTWSQGFTQTVGGWFCKETSSLEKACWLHALLLMNPCCLTQGFFQNQVVKVGHWSDTNMEKHEGFNMYPSDKKTMEVYLCTFFYGFMCWCGGIKWWQPDEFQALLQGTPLEAVGRLLDLAWQLRRQTPHPPAKRTGWVELTWELGAAPGGNCFFLDQRKVPKWLKCVARLHILIHPT